MTNHKTKYIKDYWFDYSKYIQNINGTLSDSDITLRPSSYKVGVDKFKCIDAVDSLCLPINVKMSKLVNF